MEEGQMIIHAVLDDDRDTMKSLGFRLTVDTPKRIVWEREE